MGQRGAQRFPISAQSGVKLVLVVTKYVIEVSRLSYVFSKLAIYLLSG